MKTRTLRPALLIVVAALAACARGGPAPTAQLAATPAEIATQAIPPTDAPAEPLVWEAAFLQNGQTLQIQNDTVTLARAPFTLQVQLPQPLAVKLNAYTTDQNFLALQPGFVFSDDCLLALCFSDDCLLALCTGMDAAEDRLNPDQLLFVDVELTHYLYYQAPDDHRWSRAEVTAGGATFERDVAVLNSTPIEQTTDPALYLLLFANACQRGQRAPDRPRRTEEDRADLRPG
jgi:hypothetical protein